MKIDEAIYHIKRTLEIGVETLEKKITDKSEALKDAEGAQEDSIKETLKELKSKREALILAIYVVEKEECAINAMEYEIWD